MGSRTWRKAYGALKDSTKVGLANFYSEYKDLDIASEGDEPHGVPAQGVLPQEYTLRDLSASPVSRHRLLDMHAREEIGQDQELDSYSGKGTATFKEDFMTYSHRGTILQMRQFKDDSSVSLDCLAWVRTYVLYLDERVECFRVLKYDVEADRLLKLPQASGKAFCKCHKDLVG